MNQQFKPDDVPCLVLSVWQIEELEDKAYEKGVADTLKKLEKKKEEILDE